MSRIVATVWFCLISSWQRQHLMGSCHTLKTKYVSQEFESISQIAARMTGEIRSYESKKPFQKKINYVEYFANDESEEKQETVASAEWI